LVDNSLTWWNMLETLPHRYQPATQRREYRYPYLDRNLVDFLLRVPPSQLLRPGRRRYLMRNALQSIVPSEILERKRKAFVVKSPMVRFSQDRERIATLFVNSELCKTNVVDTKKLQEALEETNGQKILSSLAPLFKAVQLELWLRGQQLRGDPIVMPRINTATKICMGRR
jgi:asparagine synthase (glutamine-hydrolysing)